MTEIKIVFHTEDELECFIDALVGLRDSDSDGFTQALGNKKFQVSMCTTPQCQNKENK